MEISMGIPYISSRYPTNLGAFPSPFVITPMWGSRHRRGLRERAISSAGRSAPHLAAARVHGGDMGRPWNKNPAG